MMSEREREIEKTFILKFHAEGIFQFFMNTFIFTCEFNEFRQKPMMH